MRLVEHPRLLDPDRGERTDGEEAAVVEFSVGAPPVDQFVVLLGEHGVDRSGVVRAGAKPEAMLVVANFTVDDADLVDAAAEHRDAHPVVGGLPVDVERFGVARATAVLQQIPPPSVDRGEATPTWFGTMSASIPMPTAWAWWTVQRAPGGRPRVVDRRVVDDVVTVVRTGLGRQEGRHVDPVGSEVVEVGDRVRSAGQVRRGDLQPVGGDGPGGLVHGRGVFMGGAFMGRGVQGGVQGWLRSSNVRLPRHRWSRTLLPNVTSFVSTSTLEQAVVGYISASLWEDDVRQERGLRGNLARECVPAGGDLRRDRHELRHLQ